MYIFRGQFFLIFVFLIANTLEYLCFQVRVPASWPSVGDYSSWDIGIPSGVVNSGRFFPTPFFLIKCREK